MVRVCVCVCVCKSIHNYSWTMRDITQLDNHLPTLTVKETLQFSSKCIVPQELSNPTADKQRVDVSFPPLHFLFIFVTCDSPLNS